MFSVVKVSALRRGRIFAAKERPRFNPLIAHFASTEAAFRQVAANPAALMLAEKLPEQAFRGIRADLLPLLAATADPAVRMKALECFASTRIRRRDR